MTDVSITLDAAEKAAVIRFLSELRPIYEETQLTGYNPLTEPNALTVVGNTFYKGGVRTTLRGVSISSLIWTNPDTIMDSLEAEPMYANINVVRIPIHYDHWTSESYTKQEFIDDYIIPYVGRVTAAGKYCILDCHPVANYNTDTMAWVFDFWEYLAPVFRYDPLVIYELFNEPIGNGIGGGTDTSLGTWTAYKLLTQPLIDYIRKKAPSNHIIMGSPSWSTRIGHADTHPFVDGNISYTFHNYPNFGSNYGAQLQLFLQGEIPTSSVPVFTTEWGFEDASLMEPVVGIQNNTYYPDVMNRFFLDNPQISWTGWCYDTESRPAMLAAEGAASLAFMEDMLAIPVSYTPLDTPLTIADYIDVPNTIIAWDALRSTMTGAPSAVSDVTPLIGTAHLTQVTAGDRMAIDSAGINGQSTFYNAGGYNGDYFDVDATFLNSKNLLTFVSLIKPVAGNLGNAPVFTFGNGGATEVTLTSQADGTLVLAVKGGGTIKYLTGTTPVNGVETLVLITVDFTKQIFTLEYTGQAILINTNFGTTAFSGASVGVISGNAGGSDCFKGHIGLISVIDGIYEYRYRKALLDYIAANR